MRERDIHSGMRERDIHSSVRERDIHSSMRERDIHSGMRERDIHSSMRERDIHSSMRERHSQRYDIGLPSTLLDQQSTACSCHCRRNCIYADQYMLGGGLFVHCIW